MVWFNNIRSILYFVICIHLEIQPDMSNLLRRKIHTEPSSQ